MSSVVYLNTQLPVLVVSLLWLLTWVFFILNRDAQTISGGDKSGTLIREKSPVGLVSETVFGRVTLVTLIAFTLIALNLRFVGGFIIFEQLMVNSFSRDMLIVLSTFYIILQFITCNVSFCKVNLSLEYLYSLSIFFVMSPLLYFSASIYSFFFLLEVLGVLVVLLFSSLTYLGSKRNLSNEYASDTVNPAPARLITSLFTQFWISFFSTVLLILFLIVSLFVWNTSMYYELNAIIVASNVAPGTAHSAFIVLWDFLFIFGFFLKAGIAPLHLFKIEVYRGLPFFTIFIYTFLYFLSFFLYFIYMVHWLLPHILYYNTYFLELIIIFGVLYLSATLFSNRHLKTFLALSSILNSLIIFAVVVPLAV